MIRAALCLLLGAGMPGHAGPSAAAVRDADLAVPAERAPEEKPAAKAGGEARAPAPPTKAVEEPVFQMPELVIIGENQARIMAQKEQLAGTPMRGLHEAPLLEKEEGSITALRQRQPPPRPVPVEPGPVAVAKLEGGSPAWFGGAAWLGRQESRSLVGLDLAGSYLEGEPVATGRVGGWDTRAALEYARVFDRAEMRGREENRPGWMKYVQPQGLADGESVSGGWRGSSRNLPRQSADARRRLDRWFVAGDSLRSPSGVGETARVEFVRDSTPQAALRGLFLGGSGRVPLARRGDVTIRMEPRVEMESARVTGDHLLAGTLVEAVWTSSERWRYSLGFTADGVYGGGLSAGSLRPAGGVSWTAAAGPTLSASFAPAMRAAWFAEQAPAVPYALFTGRMEPERVLADFELKVWQEAWDGSEGHASYRYRESRNALTWSERGAEGLWEPAMLPGLRLQEFSAGFRYGAWRPVVLYAEGKWRSVGTDSGQVTNLPRGEGVAGVEFAWEGLTAGAELEILRSRPRSAEDGAAELDPCVDLRARVSYRLRRWMEIYGRAENLTGNRVERWGGYPEPKPFGSAGALVSF